MKLQSRAHLFHRLFFALPLARFRCAKLELVTCSTFARATARCFTFTLPLQLSPSSPSTPPTPPIHPTHTTLTTLYLSRIDSTRPPPSTTTTTPSHKLMLVSNAACSLFHPKVVRVWNFQPPHFQHHAPPHPILHIPPTPMTTFMSPGFVNYAQ